jgi:hypothetical protein
MKHHLLIAGTGRAGTSFLVQYLHGCKLETHLTHHPEAKLYEEANAGLEDIPIDGRPLPYVIKTPWLFEFVERFLSRKDIAVDVVVLPMRDLVEVASSRVTLEMRARYASLNDSGVLEECTKWETWGKTKGGVVYSLNPIDQARILAMGFHQVIHAFVKRAVPIVFLDFSRMIEDGAYLYEQLRPYLPESVDREAALALHQSLAAPDLMRMASELGGGQAANASADRPHGTPSFETLDRAALLRELKAARKLRLPLHKRLFRSRKRKG